MSEIVERVARAIFADMVRGTSRPDWAWEETSDTAKETWCRTARAAIAALREPTDAMLAGVIRFPGHLLAEHPDHDDPWHNQMLAATQADRMALRQRWIDLIDEALKP